MIDVHPVRIDPGTQKDVWVSELGADSNTYLMIYNPSTTTEGSWEIITAIGGFDGSFASITDGYSVRRQGDSLFLQVGSVLAGDYNEDGTVDAADYTVWRDGLGTTYTEADYDVWKEHFGETSGSGSLAGNAAVPEPTAFTLVALAVIALASVRQRRQ